MSGGKVIFGEDVKRLTVAVYFREVDAKAHIRRLRKNAAMDGRKLRPVVSVDLLPAGHAVRLDLTDEATEGYAIRRYLSPPKEQTEVVLDTKVVAACLLKLDAKTCARTLGAKVIPERGVWVVVVPS